MAGCDEWELSDDDENSLLISCVESYENCAVDSLKSSNVPSEIVENEEKNYQSVERQIDNNDSALLNDGKKNEKSNIVAGNTSCQQMNRILLKGSALLGLVRSGYVWVSDLSSQVWCEMQLYYYLTLPLQMPVQFEKSPAMEMGSTIHLARELSVQDFVNVPVESKEDGLGIKVLNLLSAVNTFHSNGMVVRETPIFGMPFGKNLFVVGLIDELRFDPVTYTIDLVELKTRKNRTIPNKSQKMQHRFQVMLYRKLFDDLVNGLLSKTTIGEKFAVNLGKKFNPDLLIHIVNSGFHFENLNQLLDYVLQLMQSLTCVSQTVVEYVHQDTMEPFAEEKIVYSEAELRNLFEHYADFWLGKRDPIGVDIEDAYKCQICEHADICEWRERKNQEYTQKNLNATIKYLPSNKVIK